MGEKSVQFLVSAASYAVIYPSLVEVARSLGYALAIHGSMTRDFDLIAVPWTADAADHFTLAEALKNQLSAVFIATHYDDLDPTGRPLFKLHGRTCYTIHLTDSGMYGPYVDLSIMPRVQSDCAASVGETSGVVSAAVAVPGQLELSEADAMHPGNPG